MSPVCRGGVIVVIGSPVRIGRGPSAIGGPIAHISEIVGRPSALGAAVAVDAQSRRRAATAGSCTPPAGAGAVRSHQRQARCGESLAVGRGWFDQGQPSQCRKKSVQSPKAALGRSRPRANPTCLRTLQVRWIPTSRSAKRNGGSSTLSWQSRRHVHGPAWLVRTGVLVWLRIRRARPVCSVRRSTADGTARKRQTRTRLIGRDTSQEPSAVVGERLDAMADKATRRRVPMLSTHWDASHPAHANAIVMILHVPPVAARAGAALVR